MTAPRQLAVLAGGLGTRLGDLTRDLPKPLMPVAGKPFLQHLLEKARRHDLDRVLLLSGHLADRIQAWLDESRIAQRLDLEVTLSIEPSPLGTGGALVQALSALDPTFLLVNGDTWFDLDWRVLADMATHPVVAALRAVDAADRYETVLLDAGRVTAFQPRGAVPAGHALINGGAYRIDRAALPDWPGAWSLENRLLPALAAEGRLGGAAFDAPFIDIGVPDALVAAQTLLAHA